MKFTFYKEYFYIELKASNINKQNCFNEFISTQIFQLKIPIIVALQRRYFLFNASINTNDSHVEENMTVYNKFSMLVIINSLYKYSELMILQSRSTDP